MSGRSNIRIVAADTPAGLARARIIHLCLPWLWRSRVYWRRDLVARDLVGIARREVDRAGTAAAYVNIHWRKR